MQAKPMRIDTVFFVFLWLRILCENVFLRQHLLPCPATERYPIGTGSRLQWCQRRIGFYFS
jgi:hypothetical protein